MTVRTIAGTADTSVQKHTDTGSNTLPASTHYAFLYDDTQITTIGQARKVLNAIQAQLLSNSSLKP